ncbi:MAG: histidine phosphatase family protein [Coriobacteriia bacterium]|nr:histidine phosphatase family protein [Actinomycetota bacterium]MDZ4167370.1 histidine phosphatase family protein [Coriobacteriia bacterium]
MSDPAHEILVIRHPETLANASGHLIGRSDSPISPLGTVQTAALARHVAEWQPEIIFSSPLGRALDTARAIAPGGTPVELVDDLMEIDFGSAEGLTWAELRSRGIALDYSGGPVAPGGEAGVDFMARVGRAAARVADGPSRAAVVTHGGMFRHLLTTWLRLPAEAAWRFEVPNAGMAVVRLHADTGVLERLGPPLSSA